MICEECGEDLKHKAHGLCQQCYSKQYAENHKVERKISNKKYRINNRDKIREYKRRHHYAHGGKPASENKQCPTFLGVHVAERVLSKVFKDVKRMPPCHRGYDFICNKGKKIDVKSACTETRYNRRDSWNFRINKNTIANYFLCLAFDNREDLNPLHIWLIPAKLVNHRMHISVSESTLSKWDKYKLDINKVISCCNTIK